MDEDEHSDEMDAEVDDSPVELTLEEKETLLKKSRWNVFLSLGLAIIMFILSLVPISTGLVVDSYSKDYDTGQLYGIPISGADFTDIPTDVVLTIEQLPVSTKSIDVFLIEAESCVIESNGIMQEYTDKDGNTLSDIRLEVIENGPRHQWQHAVIDAPVIGQEYVLSFEVDPGMYCMQIITDAEFKTPNSVNVDVQFKFYPFQIIAGVIAIISLGLSIFAFIGAQKHGQWVRDAKLPTGKSVEQEILDQTSQERISAGPSGPPSGPSGPSGPPSGPSGPPSSSGPSGPPSSSGPAGPPEPSWAHLVRLPHLALPVLQNPPVRLLHLVLLALQNPPVRLLHLALPALQTQRQMIRLKQLNNHHGQQTEAFLSPREMDITSEK